MSANCERIVVHVYFHEISSCPARLESARKRREGKGREGKERLAVREAASHLSRCGVSAVVVLVGVCRGYVRYVLHK